MRCRGYLTADAAQDHRALRIGPTGIGGSLARPETMTPAPGRPSRRAMTCGDTEHADGGRERRTQQQGEGEPSRASSRPTRPRAARVPSRAARPTPTRTWTRPSRRSSARRQEAKVAEAAKPPRRTRPRPSNERDQRRSGSTSLEQREVGVRHGRRSRRQLAGRSISVPDGLGHARRRRPRIAKAAVDALADAFGRGCGVRREGQVSAARRCGRHRKADTGSDVMAIKDTASQRAIREHIEPVPPTSRKRHDMPAANLSHLEAGVTKAADLAPGHLHRLRQPLRAGDPALKKLLG